MKDGLDCECVINISVSSGWGVLDNELFVISSKSLIQ